MKKLLIATTSLMLTVGSTSCKSSKDSTEDQWASERSTTEKRMGERADRMSPEDLFATLDLDKSGTLIKSEVKGRLAEQFDKVDTDGDGSLSLEEVKNMPKPQGGKRRGSAPR